MASPRVILHGFWASSCTWRVRCALHLKNISYEERPVDIVAAKNQLTDQFRTINPAMKVPALEIDGATLIESMAIIQYLEETRPSPALAPDAPLKRAQMREIVEIIVSGMQPLQNIGLKERFDSKQQYQRFALFHVQRGLEVLETLLNNTSGSYCVGNQLTLADLCFIPQMINCTGSIFVNVHTDASFICQLYNAKKSIDVDDGRYQLFVNNYKASDVNENFTKKILNFDASSIPPCKSELYQQLLRAHYISSVWRNAYKKQPTTLDPLEYGWIEQDDKFVFKWFEGDQLPTSVSDLIIEVPDSNSTDDEDELHHDRHDSDDDE